MSTIISGSAYTTTTSLGTATATQVPYPAANSSDCGSWALVDNVCCPYYCTSNNESESCTSSCSGGCSSPESSMCKSGTMCKSPKPQICQGCYANFELGGEQTTVGSDETWHYSVISIRFHDYPFGIEY